MSKVTILMVMMLSLKNCSPNAATVFPGWLKKSNLSLLMFLTPRPVVEIISVKKGNVMKNLKVVNVILATLAPFVNTHLRSIKPWSKLNIK